MSWYKKANDVTFFKSKNGAFPSIDAYLNGVKVGEVVYCLDFPNKGELNIEWIEVSEGYRRKGISRSLIQKIQELNPEYKIVGRTISDASTAMIKDMGLYDRRGK